MIEMSVKNMQKKENSLSAVLGRMDSNSLDWRAKERAMLLVNFLSIAAEQASKGQCTEEDVLKASQNLIREDLRTSVFVKLRDDLETKTNLAIQFILSDKQFAIDVAGKFIEQRVQIGTICGIGNSRTSFESLESTYDLELKLLSRELQALVGLVYAPEAKSDKAGAAGPCIVSFRG